MGLDTNRFVPRPQKAPPPRPLRENGQREATPKKTGLAPGFLDGTVLGPQRALSWPIAWSRISSTEPIPWILMYFGAPSPPLSAQAE